VKKLLLMRSSLRLPFGDGRGALWRKCLSRPFRRLVLGCSRCRPLHLELRGARDAAKPPGRRVSVLGDLLELQATWRPTSWICNRVTRALPGACAAVLLYFLMSAFA